MKYALSANIQNGQRRTNADKRRCVEVALSEFPKLSNRKIAELCGVGKSFVSPLRPAQVATKATSKDSEQSQTRTGIDGKIYTKRRVSFQVLRQFPRDLPGRVLSRVVVVNDRLKIPMAGEFRGKA